MKRFDIVAGMKNRVALRVLLSIGLLACRYPAQAQKAVLVVRHGEKISDADERLTEAGRARAERLAKMLKDAGVTAIYSTDTERTRDTVQPLAAALGCPGDFKIASDEYDNLFLIVPKADGPATLLRLRY